MIRLDQLKIREIKELREHCDASVLNKVFSGDMGDFENSEYGMMEMTDVMSAIHYVIMKRTNPNWTMADTEEKDVPTMTDEIAGMLDEDKGGDPPKPAAVSGI